MLGEAGNTGSEGTGASAMSAGEGADQEHSALPAPKGAAQE